MSAVPPGWQAVLDFWFLPAETEGHGKPRPEWFRKDPAFDAAIRGRFGGLVEQARSGHLREWDATPRGALARILLLDQFTRNIYRDTPLAFAGDEAALHAAQAMLDEGADRRLAPIGRWFAYLPFMHAEAIGMQERSVALFEGLAKETGAFADPLDYAIRHRDVVARFGRFPHRNEILGRATSAEEAEFLKQPGSRF